MDRLECEPYLFDTITNLAEDPNIELYLLQNNTKGSETLIKKVANRIRDDGIFRFIDLALFILITSVERKIIGSIAIFNEFSEQFIEKRLDAKIFAGTVLLTPVFSKTKITKRNILVSYNDADIEKIHALGLDLILRGNGTGIYQGKILSVSKRGIISFHHGDNRWNRGGPPGFWEIYFKKPDTGFVIQILNEKIDDGDVIFRGEVATQVLYSLNFGHILRVARPFMERIIKDYAATGTLPATLPKTPYSNTVLKVPKLTETLTYVARTATMFTTFVLTRKVLRIIPRWSVAFVRSDWKTANLSKAIVVKSPPGRFLADPFVATINNQTVMFVEDYNYSTKQGTISAIRIFPDGSYNIVIDVIREKFHLSFPYLFEFEGTLYIIPESHQAKAIRLYKCVRFPYQWEYLYDIMQDVVAADTVVFEHSDKWWMLTNIAPDGTTELDSQLCVFSATSPLSKEWQPHAKNPICFSPGVGRNGGVLRDADGTIFRVRQKQGYNQYGMMFSIAKITRLNTEGYEEEFYCEVEPKFFPGLIGTHHMYSAGGITVFDFLKEENTR